MASHPSRAPPASRARVPPMLPVPVVAKGSPMTRLEMVQQAVNELGDVSSQEIAAYVLQKHGIIIEASIVAIIRAVLWRQEMKEQLRRDSKHDSKHAS